jgi:outer membrane immunogenic protein
MGDANNSFSTVNPISAAFLNNRITQDVDMVTVRVNYRFGWGGSAAPRY